MAAKSRLKVFRTPIGFHDAYVAAASQKAALEAWGTSTNLFARGAAEVVTDPALTAEPLAAPGKVIKRLRGTEAEQIAALPEARPQARSRGAKPPPAKKDRPPRPSRSPLDAAEQAIAQAEARHRAEADALAREQAALDARRSAMESANAKERATLERVRDRAEKDYDEAVRRWNG